jgi:hypothetical protein
MRSRPAGATVAGDATVMVVRGGPGVGRTYSDVTEVWRP